MNKLMVSYMYLTDMEKLTDQKSREILLLILQSLGYKLGAFTSYSLFLNRPIRIIFNLYPLFASFMKQLMTRFC